MPHYGEEGYTLDRIDNNRGYEPGNLRFVDMKTQARNRRNNLFTDYKGQRMLLVDIASITGIAYATLKQRFHKGWRDDELIKPVKKRLPKSDLVLIQNHEVWTESLTVAKVFDKRHDHVIRDIRKLIADLEKIGVSPNLGTPPESKAVADFRDIPVFVESTYVNEQNKQTYPMYLLNRNALTLLVMNFDGLKALEWKLKYIAEFNRMEKALIREKG